MARFIMSAACSGAFFVRPRRNYKLWLCGAVAAKERPPGEQTKSPPTNPPFFPLSAQATPTAPRLPNFEVPR